MDLRALGGPNLYCLSPVIILHLDLQEYQGVESSTIEGFNQRLLHILPSLREHYCSIGSPGGFLGRLKEGTYLGHILEHVALELQHLCGDDVTYGSTRKLGGGKYRIIFEYSVKEAGLRAGEGAFTIIKALLEGRELELSMILQQLHLIYDKGLGPSTKKIVTAAKAMGIPILLLDPEKSLIQLGYGAKQRRVAATISDETSCLAVDIACDKVQTKRLLGEMDLPVAKGFVINNKGQALEKLEILGPPVVVKPCHGNQGKGVLAGLKNKDQLLEALNIAWEISPQLLLEKHVEGRDYRILVVDNQVVAVAERRPPKVVGDGRRTIEELILAINRDPKRGHGHERPLTQIPINRAILFHLSCQGYNLKTIPSKGEVVLLLHSGNLSCGGTAQDVTPLIHPQTTQVVLEAVSFIGLDVAGVDIITPHISRPLLGEGAIIEINGAPGLRMHYYPTKGEPRDVAKAIVKKLFPEKGRGKIPIVAITGTNGKTTITRLLSFMLREQGLLVGTATSLGIFLNERRIKAGDMTGPWSARYLLQHPKVEAAVLETARGGLLREGLGFSSCKLALISNISQDHLGQDGINTLEEMAHLKGLLLEVVEEDGYSILNADDPLLLKISPRAKGEIIYTSSHPNNAHLMDHLKAGGKGVYRDEKGKIILAHKEERKILLSSQEVPLTLKGYAKHQLENVILSIAAAWALQISPSLISSCLRRFTPNKHNPGRFNLFEGGGIRVILDYAHNLEGYRGTISTAQQIYGDPLIGVIGMPGDRRDEDIVEVGCFAGHYLSKAYIKEDDDLRGRRRREVSHLLISGLHLAPNSCPYEEVGDEREAIKRAIAQASSGDTILFFYEKEEKDRIGIIEEGLKEKESLAVPQLLDC